MADSEASRDDRQLAPSERRLQKARAEGNVARSRDIGHALVLGAALLGFVAAGPAIGRGALELVRAGLRFSRTQALDPAGLTGWLANSAGAAMWIIVPASATLAVAAAAATMIPGGVVLTGKPATPDFSRISPASGFSRIFSRESAIDLVKLALVAVALGSIAVWFAATHFEQYAALASIPLAPALQTAHEGLSSGVGLLVGLLFAVALVDVPMQWFRHRGRLKMTHQEARQEMRESEGDPMVKSRIRARQREIAKGRMLAAVPTADVVITNPTHYAVAIRYEDGAMAAPRVVAKGADHLAARIREVAMDSGVPLFEAPPLARALYAHVDVDREIPSTLYTAVAQVLAYVYQLRHWVPGRAPQPRAPQDLPVPPGLDPQERAE